MELLKPYLKFIVSAVVILFVMKLIFKLIFEILKSIIIESIKTRRERKAKRKAELEMVRYRIINDDNPIMNRIIENHIITVEGDVGAGKTMTAMAITQFLVRKWDIEDQKKYRYNLLMKPNYIKTRSDRIQKGLLNVNTNMENVFDTVTGLFAEKNVFDILYQRIMAQMPSVQVVDEFGRYFPPEKFWEVVKSDAKTKKAYDEVWGSFRLCRKRLGWIIMTEQTAKTKIAQVRRSGSKDILALENHKYILPAGIRKQKRKIYCIKNCIGWFVAKPKRQFQQCLFTFQKWATFFKLFRRGFAFEKQFYINRDAIYKKISDKYMRFDQKIEFDTKCYWFTFSTKDFLAYDTLEQQGEYVDKFDSEGNRIKPIEGAKLNE